MNKKLSSVVSVLTLSMFIQMIPAEAATIRDNYQNKSSDLSICELRETKSIDEYGSRKGFPMKGALPTTGEINILIVPIDFSNAPGVGDPNKMFSDDIKKINEWSTYFSRGKLAYKTTLVSNTWIRAPKGAEWYTIAGQKGGKTQMQAPSAGIQELINEVDKAISIRSIPKK